MNKTMENAKSRLESLKAEAKAALESGKFDALTADAEGITPKTRLEWVAPSIDYILGVAAGLPQDKVEKAVNDLPASDEDELAMNFIACIVVISGDPEGYVEEGKYNVTRAMELLKDDSGEAATSDEEKGETGNEEESVLDKARKFFTGKGKKAKSGQAKPAPKKTRGGDSGDSKAELQELKSKIAKLEAAKADADERADKAEAEAKALRAKLKAMGVDT